LSFFFNSLKHQGIIEYWKKCYSNFGEPVYILKKTVVAVCKVGAAVCKVGAAVCKNEAKKGSIKS